MFCNFIAFQTDIVYGTPKKSILSTLKMFCSNNAFLIQTLLTMWVICIPGIIVTVVIQEKINWQQENGLHTEAIM